MFSMWRGEPFSSSTESSAAGLPSMDIFRKCRGVPRFSRGLRHSPEEVDEIEILSFELVGAGFHLVEVEGTVDGVLDLRELR
jgi:hypothetical protein